MDSSENSVRTSLCSNVFDLYKEAVEFRPSYSSVMVLDTHVVPVSSIRRIATALKVLLDSGSALRQLVIVKQGLHFGVTAIKELFHAIRMEGGFGGRSKHPREEYLTALCTRIAIHFDILASLIGGEVNAQKLAMRERVQELLVANWTTMRMATYRGSSVFVSALRFLNNYVHQNEITKTSIIAPSATATTSVRADESAQARSTTLFSLVFTLVVPNDSIGSGASRLNRETHMNPVLYTTACCILKSALLSVECQLWAIKSGLITRLLNDVQHRLRSYAQTKTARSDPIETQSLSQLFGVLASVASRDDGRHALYSHSTALGYIVEDICTTSLDRESSSTTNNVVESGYLFLRNLSLSKVSKSNFGVWEAALSDHLLKRLLMHQEGSSPFNNPVVLRYLSCTLWSLVFDNQKARTMLLARPSILRGLEHVLATRKAGISFESDESVENLERVLHLVQQ
uniref:Uncharacterized protein n=1 Tax=Globisporangium ultimum (strain ATCC 200006 / CBS 805.95 / DAOM BR144) TaxID=431595 RepID=K3WZF0_GLOUD